MSGAKISPRLKWIEPYLELGITFIPKGKRIERVGAWTITNKRVGRVVRRQFIAMMIKTIASIFIRRDTPEMNQLGLYQRLIYLDFSLMSLHTRWIGNILLHTKNLRIKY